jgi:hypothetical protein
MEHPLRAGGVILPFRIILSKMTILQDCFSEREATNSSICNAPYRERKGDLQWGKSSGRPFYSRIPECLDTFLPSFKDQSKAFHKVINVKENKTIKQTRTRIATIVIIITICKMNQKIPRSISKNKTCPQQNK